MSDDYAPDPLRDGELEKQAIGYSLAWPADSLPILRRLPVTAFAYEHWREAFASIAALDGQGHEPQLDRVRVHLQERHKLDLVGLGRLMGSVDGLPRPGADYLNFLVGRINELARARAFRATARASIGELEANPGLISDGLLSRHLDHIDSIRRSGAVGLNSVTTIAEVVAEVVEDVKSGNANRIKLGIPCLDTATRGLEPGELFGDLGRTDSLKTMTYLNRLRHLVARYPDGCWLVANMEMPKRQMLRRLLRMELGMTESQLDHAIEQANPALDEAAAKYGGRLFFVDRGSVSLSEIEAAAEELRLSLPADRPLRGIFIDHAGLVRPERPMSSAYERGTACAIGLKQMARRLELIVFVVIQSNRAGKPEDNKPVGLEASRDSGAFEENVDFMLCYSCKIEPLDRAETPHIALRLAKNRRGVNVPFELGFDPTTLRMEELSWSHRGQ